jgi:hypothetical protein
MLVLHPLPGAAAEGATAFPDHLERGVAHVLPDALELALDAAGAPDLLVLRYAGDDDEPDGGLVRLRLEPTQPAAAVAALQADGYAARPVATEAARARLRLRLPGDPDALAPPWLDVAVPGGDVLLPAATLTAREAQVVHQLVEAGAAVAEVDVDLRYRGLLPTLPWLAVPGPALAEQLEVQLPDGPVTAAHVQAVVAGLAPETWTLHALAPGAPAPDPERFAQAVTGRVLEERFDREPGADPFAEPRYVLRDAADVPAEAAWDLAVGRTEARTHRLTWSLDAAVAALPADRRAAVFPTVIVASLVSAATVHVVSTVPVSPDAVRSVSVDLRFDGASGLPEHKTVRFDGTTAVQRVALAHLGDDRALSRRVDVTVAGADGGWPRLLRGREEAVPGAVVEVSPATAGVDVLRVDARPEVFDHAARLEVALARAADPADAPPLARMRLDATVRGRWVALPGVAADEPLVASVVAHGDGDDGAVLGLPPRAVNRPSLVIAGAELEPADPDAVRFELAAEDADRIDFAAVSVRTHRGESVYRTVDGEGAVVRMFRSSLLERLAYEWQSEIAARDADGRVLPLARGPWTAASEPLVRIALPPAAGAAQPARHVPTPTE